MSRKKSDNTRWLCTALTAIIVISVFTVGIGILPVSAGVASVTRELPDGPVSTDEEIVVSLTQTGFFGGLGSVKEWLPDDFAYVVGSLTGNANESYNPVTNELIISFDSNETTVTYNVTTSSYAQIAEFEGRYKAFFLSPPYYEDGDVTGKVKVEVKLPYGVELTVDDNTRTTDANDNATYYITVENIGANEDTYDLNITAPSEADLEVLSKESVTLDAGESEEVELNVASYLAGDYDTTVEARSTKNPSVSNDIMVTTTVRAFYGVELKVDGGDHAEKTVARDENAIYTLTITNSGNDADTIGLNITDNEAIFVELSEDTFLLSAGASDTADLTVRDSNVGIYHTTVIATSQGYPSEMGTVTVTTNVTEVVDAEAPVVTNPTATPQVIPEDTDNEPLWGELAHLSVVVTDESTITSVTIDLSSIGGSATQAMTPNGDNVWYYETNASIDSAIFEAGSYVPHLLQVTATNVYENSNTSVSIELTVMKNGDVDESGVVNLDDGIYLVNYALLVPGYDVIPEIADVDGNSAVNLDDGIYLVNYALGVPGYELH